MVMREMRKGPGPGRRRPRALFSHLVPPLVMLPLFLLSLLSPVSSWAQARWGQLSRTVLSNGLTLIVQEYRQVPLARLLLLLPGGASLEGSGKAGLAYMTAELLLKGTTQRNARQIAEEIDRLGGDLSASASYDYCAVTLEVLSSDLGRGLDLMMDCLLHPSFPAQELERKRSEALAAISRSQEEPEAIAEKRFRSLLYGSHPYGSPLGGTRDSLTAITREDVLSFYRQTFWPDQAILVAVGDFRAEEMRAELEARFSSWSRGGSALPLLSTAPPPRLQGRRVVVVDKPDVTQARILMGNSGPPRDTPHFFPLSLANAVLGRMGFSSRLMDRLRSREGLTYHVESYFSMGKAGGSFVIETSTRTEKVGSAISAILEEVRSFREKGLRAEELTKAKTYRKGIYYIALQSMESLVAQLAEIEFYGLPKDLIESYRERVDRVSLEEANEAARQFFPSEDLLIVILGNASPIEDQLRDPEGRGWLHDLAEVKIEKFERE